MIQTWKSVKLGDPSRYEKSASWFLRQPHFEMKGNVLSNVFCLMVPQSCLQIYATILLSSGTTYMCVSTVVYHSAFIGCHIELVVSYHMRSSNQRTDIMHQICQLCQIILVMTGLSVQIWRWKAPPPPRGGRVPMGWGPPPPHTG